MFRYSHGRGRIFTGKKEEPGIKAKKWESVHASVFQLRVPVLQMLREDDLCKNCPNNSVFNPRVQKRALCGASFTCVLRPCYFSYGFEGAGTARLASDRSGRAA